MSFTKLKINLLLFCIFIFVACNNSKTIDVPLKVKTFQITDVTMQKGLSYSGTIQAGKNVTLSFLAMGTVNKINVREGDKVTKGQLLAQIDSQSSQNSLQIAKAKEAQAKDAFKRFEPMYIHGNLPEIKMVEIKTAKTQAELAVKIAQKNVNDCSLYAPETGYISQRDVELGDNIIPGKTVLKLVTIDKIYAEISVPEKEIQKIKKGMDATVELSDDNSNKLNGTVADVGVSADILSRTYTVRILITNPNANILPGMLCNIYISQKETVSQMTIPATAIKVDEIGKESVYIVDTASKKVHKQYIKSNGFRKGEIIISSGLQLNDIIVEQGVQKLDDNMSVEF